MELGIWIAVRHVNARLCSLKNSFPTSCLQRILQICQAWGFVKAGWEKMLKKETLSRLSAVGPAARSAVWWHFLIVLWPAGGWERMFLGWLFFFWRLGGAGMPCHEGECLGLSAALLWSQMSALVRDRWWHSVCCGADGERTTGDRDSTKKSHLKGWIKQ